MKEYNVEIQVNVDIVSSTLQVEFLSPQGLLICHACKCFHSVFRAVRKVINSVIQQ